MTIYLSNDQWLVAADHNTNQVHNFGFLWCQIQNYLFRATNQVRLLGGGISLQNPRSVPARPFKQPSQVRSPCNPDLGRITFTTRFTTSCHFYSRKYHHSFCLSYHLRPPSDEVQSQLIIFAPFTQPHNHLFGLHLYLSHELNPNESQIIRILFAICRLSLPAISTSDDHYLSEPGDVI